MSPQLYPFVRGISHFFRRHHPIIFFIVITSFFGTAIYSLYAVQMNGLADPGMPPSTVTTFDQETIDKIKSLHISEDKNYAPLIFPSPRSNPFVD